MLNDFANMNLSMAGKVPTDLQRKKKIIQQQQAKYIRNTIMHKPGKFYGIFATYITLTVLKDTNHAF